MDELATIALSTSPTLPPFTYESPSPSFQSVMPLSATVSRDPAEPPAKRPRWDKNPPSYSHRFASATDTNQSAQDSMNADAELLLSLRRASHFHPSQSRKMAGLDQSYPHYGHGGTHQKAANGDGMYQGRDPQSSKYNLSATYNMFPSRVRSQSDGSTISRPTIRDVRPNTSSSTLPPVVWQDGSEKHGWNPPVANKRSNPADVDGFYGADIQKPADSLKVEDGIESEDFSQTSCAACNLVRTPTETNEQDEDTWISCDGCKQWFHIVCAGFKNDREVRNVDRFICRACRPIHGQTTFVRKSSRARTAIDYAGLNQGLVKTPADAFAHHYIEPIREGRIKFLPEAFPRMPPDLVSAEYFERGIGMTEPIVIPAHLNTRASVESNLDSLAQEAPTQDMFDELLELLPQTDKGVEQVIDCGQDQLDMVIPEGLSVKAVTELYGPEERVEVIDVKSQQGEDKRWNMQKWLDYYESAGEKVVRNVISLEISHSRLGRLIRRPKVVRDLDLQDAVWPDELKAIGDFPKVQLYCLMSVADCYTDFHIDFGGSSVFYTILKGKKTFFFIPPKDKNLKKYEEWCNSPAQDSTFLGDQTKECYRVDLSEGDTMMIPSGWIHAVWTPENSLVIGGNFLTRLNYGMQIKIANIERDTKVPRKFRYPFFQKLQWYTALRYMEDDPIPQQVLDSFARDENYRFHRDSPIYYEFGDKTNTEPPGSSYYNSRFYSQGELEGLPQLVTYLLRTAMIAESYLVEGVTMEARNAIRRSIPKGAGNPIDTIRQFGIWVAWKRGNEAAPSWTRPGQIESNPKVVMEKKPAGRPSRRSERHADNQRMYAERQAVQRPPEQPADSTGPIDSRSSAPSDVGTPAPNGFSSPDDAKQEIMGKPSTVAQVSGLGPKKHACDACRKKRTKCCHKDDQPDMPVNPMAVNVFGPGIQSQLLGHNAPTALDSLAAAASNANFQDSGSLHFDYFDNTAMYNPAVVHTPSATTARVNDLSPDSMNSAKKGRSKACDDCRKSKVCAASRPLLLLIQNSVVAYMTSMEESTRSRRKNDRSPELQTP